MNHHSRKEEPTSLQAIPMKANLVLKVVLSLLLIIGVRLWHLAVVEHDKKMEEAFHPRRKQVLEPAPRGTIRDRFNTVLAANKLDYRLTIVYSQFRDIPAWQTSTDKNGNKTRRYLRREYIQKLSSIVAEVLNIDPIRLEDVIHSHGALSNNIPLIIKQKLSESEFYRLAALEKDWLGIQVQRVPKRYYPKGKVACDVIGYLGPVSKEKYGAILSEMHLLSEYVTQKEQGLLEVELPIGFSDFSDAKARLLELQEKAYAINDSVGILGVEASFEEELRGYTGKRLYFADAKGNCLRELPGSRLPISGKRVLLTISSELQEFAEKLLAESEFERERAKKKQKEPVMRGGAIVALDPKTGEVLALASYPRFDPNDFVRIKNSFFDEETPSEVLRWIQNESFVGKIWDGIDSLHREEYDKKRDHFKDVSCALSWKEFLGLLLPIDSPLKEKLDPSVSIEKLIELQRDFFALRAAYPEMKLDAFVELDALKYWFEGLQTVQEKMLYVDLSRLLLWHEDISDALLAKIGTLSIEQFRSMETMYISRIFSLKKQVKQVWERHHFAAWRKEHEKQFLQEKRRQEKINGQYARPYLEYIDRESARQFDEFWKSNLQKIVGLMPMSQIDPDLVGVLKGYADLNHPLLMKYTGIYGEQGTDLIQTAVKVFSPGYSRSYAYRHAAIQGSLFKLVTAYAGLKQRYAELKGDIKASDLQLFEITDKVFKSNSQVFVGYFPSGKPIPQLYKGGRIPKSLSSNIGKIDLLKALETSSNPYFSLLAADYLKNPEDLNDAAFEFGFGTRSGIALPLEAAGKLPNDLSTNKTGLYSVAIGQHTLLTTPIQTSVMLSAIANGGAIFEPQIAKMIVGKDPHFQQSEMKKSDHFAFKESLKTVGIDVPLFSKIAVKETKNEVTPIMPKELRQIFMPESIQHTLLEGLHRVMRHLQEDPRERQRTKVLRELGGQFIGKTSTAESQERIGASCGTSSVIHNHTWFGGIAYEPGSTLRFETPELVVVVYLRYGGYGRQVAPIAAEMVRKWRQIKSAS
jgi:cell division protein FtsI/penicillin-binding protein 2